MFSAREVEDDNKPMIKFLSKTTSALFAVAIALTLIGTIRAEAQHVRNGLIGYWSFDDETIKGNKVEDLAGNNDATIMGASIKSVKGKFGEALEFGNQNGHFVDTGLQINSKQYENLTMMAWAKPYERHVAWGSVMNGDDGGWDRGYGYRHDKWEVQVGKGGDWQPGPRADFNKWQHTVVIYTPDLVVFYKDGTRFEFGNAVPTQSNNTLIIGDDIPCGPVCTFTGAIDEVFLYGRELSDREVEQNFKSRGAQAVEAASKLAVTWGSIKRTQ